MYLAAHLEMELKIEKVAFEFFNSLLPKDVCVQQVKQMIPCTRLQTKSVTPDPFVHDQILTATAHCRLISTNKIK